MLQSIMGSSYSSSSTTSYPHIVLLLFIASFCHFSRSSAKCNPDDEAGLLSLKSAITADPSGTLSTWNPNSDCCTWLGVTCGTQQRVTTLSLSGPLVGTIPSSSSLAKIQNLGAIYFQNAPNLSGAFPDFLFRLPKLVYVYITNCSLSGNLPSYVGNLTRLQALSLRDNRFTGSIPASLYDLTELIQLDLGGNLLTGNIRNGIQRLRNLSVLSLDRNKLDGAIPDFFQTMGDLRILRLSRNKFTGKFPETIANLAPKLAYLELGHNKLSGRIPEFLGNFSSLDTLDLSANRFTGTVPTSFRSLTKIFNLDLSSNLLMDPFPELAVKGIESLDLSNNRFHLGQIPKWVTSSQIIYSLKLARCGIKIKIDEWQPLQTYFYDYIDLSENQITGSPVKLLNRTEYLLGFQASGNHLRFDMGDLRVAKRMKELDVSRNSVFGKIPTEIAGLEKLNVSSNHLCGMIPANKSPLSAFVGNDCLCGSPLPPCKK